MTAPLPFEYKIRVRSGESLSGLVFVVGNPDGTAYDLSGCTARMTVRDRPVSPTALLDLVSPLGVVIDVALGTIAPYASHTVIAGLTPAVLAYDLFVLFPSGIRLPVAYGLFQVIAANTRD